MRGGYGETSVDFFRAPFDATSDDNPNYRAHEPPGRAAVLVRSKTPGKGIMVERAMYWNNRGAGTDTVGGYGD